MYEQQMAANTASDQYSRLQQIQWCPAASAPTECCGPAYSFWRHRRAKVKVEALVCSWWSVGLITDQKTILRWKALLALPMPVTFALVVLPTQVGH